MGYRHDLGLWAPAEEKQCIVYWLNSSADVCVCVVPAHPAAVKEASTASWPSRYGILQSSSSKVEPVRLTLLTCSRRPHTHRLTEGGGRAARYCCHRGGGGDETSRYISMQRRHLELSAL